MGVHQQLPLRGSNTMLSRLAVRCAIQPRVSTALLGSKEFSTAPVLTERDLANFPARVRPIEKAPTRLVTFPQEWFDALYPKTGVTGPYMALVGISTFLMSKEYFVIEHDFFAGVALAICITGIIKTAGVDWTASINKSLDEEEAALRSIRQSEIDACNAMIAKKEAVGLQLEGEYRARLAQAHQQVKKRLDYQLETANVMRRMEQKHMVDWIIGNVKSSITPAQEAAALKKCISDLKALAA